MAEEEKKEKKVCEKVECPFYQSGLCGEAPEKGDCPILDE